MLYPNSQNASNEVHQLAQSPEYRRFIVGRYTADNIDSDLYLEDDPQNFGRTRGVGDHAIVLRLSANLKTPAVGFTFGRNAARCDIAFTKDPGRRLSNIHFFIYVNKHGSVMLEDQSTNGTIVDEKLLRKSDNKPPTRTLESGSTIKIIMAQNVNDLVFLVRIPRRDGDTELAYRQNLAAFRAKTFGEDDDPNRTIGPGPSGHVSCAYSSNFSSTVLTVSRSIYSPCLLARASALSASQSTRQAPSIILHVNGAAVRNMLVSALSAKGRLQPSTRSPQDMTALPTQPRNSTSGSS